MSGWIVPFLLALGAGALSAWGVGGGTLLLVCMTLLLGVEQPTAQLVNLLFFLPAAAGGLFFHRKKGFVDRDIRRRALAPGLICSLAGAWIAGKVGVEILRRPFGVFLLLSALAMLRPGGKKRNCS